MNVADSALILSALGIGAVVNNLVTAIREKRKLGADTTSILTAAARELVEPLRKELATERAERAVEHDQHLRDLKAEQDKVAAVMLQLDAALDECRTLRRGLAAAHDELTRLRARLDGE